MKLLVAALIILIALLQYELWISPTGLRQVVSLNHTNAKLQKENGHLTQRNQVLEADVADLKSGQDAVETRARNDMGMIKQDETFYQIVQ